MRASANGQGITSQIGAQRGAVDISKDGIVQNSLSRVRKSSPRYIPHAPPSLLR